MPNKTASYARRGLPPMGRVTAWLCGLLVGVSLVGALLQRSVGVGSSLLVFDLAALKQWQLWRLLTYPFVVVDPLGLVLSVVALWLFGRWLEATWGSRHFLRFFVLSSVGAGLLAVPLSGAINLLFRDPGITSGPGAALDAMLMALALQAPNSNVLFGFVLPIKPRTLIWLLVGFQLAAGIMTGAAALSVTLGGLLMGYLLSTGYWRWSRWWPRLRMLLRRRRRGLYVVAPRHRTWH